MRPIGNTRYTLPLETKQRYPPYLFFERKIMKASQLALAVLLTATFSSAYAVNVEGGSSKLNLIEPKTSDSLPFGSGAAGIKVSTGNGLSNSINLQAGPAQRIRNKYGNSPINGGNQNANANGTANPKYLQPGDINPIAGWFSKTKLAQVWYEKRANNTEVFSVRQMADPKLPIAPKFGGMTFAKVPTAATNVFFGEWAPRRGNSNQIANSTDLNMNDGNRTVWFVGENPTANMPKLVNAKYNVLGINKHTPGKNDFYTGILTANYGTGKNELSGTISRAGDSVNFAGTNIRSNGTFDNGKANEHITGRFYGNGAEALAGIVDRTGADKDVAFGGAKK